MEMQLSEAPHAKYVASTLLFSINIQNVSDTNIFWLVRRKQSNNFYKLYWNHVGKLFMDIKEFQFSFFTSILPAGITQSKWE